MASELRKIDTVPAPQELDFLVGRQGAGGISFHDYVFNCSKYQDVINTKMAKHMEPQCLGVDIQEDFLEKETFPRKFERKKDELCEGERRIWAERISNAESLKRKEVF